MPSAPASLRVTSILSDSVTLAWEQPEHDGGDVITGYVIERRDAQRGGWTTVGSVDRGSTSFRVRKLLDGNDYYFRVAAENSVGTGRPNETPTSVEIKSPFAVPDKPRHLEVTEIAKHGITIDWQEPLSDGGAPITGYVVERRQGYSSRFIRVSKGPVYDLYYKDTAVYDGSEYEYRVLAENEAGQSPPSKPIGPVTAKDPFGKLNLLNIVIKYSNILCRSIQKRLTKLISSKFFINVWFR